MSFVLTLIGDPATSRLDNDAAAAASAALRAMGAEVERPDWLNPRIAVDIPFALATEGLELRQLRRAVGAHLASMPYDLAVQRRAGRRKALLLADMESTIIGQEMLDELAAMLDLGPEIAEITARAMRGELDFGAALRARVALLRGVRAEVLRDASARMTLNPGARTLVATMRSHGARTILVSGGFSIFTSQIRELCGFDEERANRLLFDGDKLTGEVAEPILDRHGKVAALREAAEGRGLAPADAVAVGDGANDLEMVRAAGLGVAYRAKAILRDAAAASVDHGDLTALLYLQGYRRQELTTA